MSNLVFRTNFLKGESGNSIASIDKTGSDEEKDTYTITLTDGSTTTFTVEKGDDLNVLNLAPEENATASKAYAVGEHLVYNGIYYEVTTEIAHGDTLEEGVNIERKRVGAEIEDVNNSISQIIGMIYPVGSIYMSANDTNPSTLFGGTWVAWGSGKVPVGIDTSDTDFNTAEKTGGAKTHSYTPSGTVGGHTLTVSEMPAHTHYEFTDADSTVPLTGSSYPAKVNSIAGEGLDYYKYEVSGASTAPTQGISGSTGGGGSHNHGFTGTASNINSLQPYITCYMWKRTA